MKVEEGRPATDAKPSAGPVYRSIYAKDGLLEVPSDFESLIVMTIFKHYYINNTFIHFFFRNTHTHVIKIKIL